MQAVSHPNLIELVEIHESVNSLYLVMELLEGGEIFSLTGGKLDAESTYHTFKYILKGLVELDKHGIMHRDLKPDNIIMKYKNKPIKDNILKLVDFGLATYADIDEYLFKRCGTPGFVAPEVINAAKGANVKYSTKCDVFSVGIIFFFMLTGKIPYDGKDFQEVLDNNKKATIDFSIKELKCVGPIALSLLKDMLEISPANRPSAAECLKHEYFTSNTAASMVFDNEPEDIDLAGNLKDFKDKYKKGGGLTDSIHFNANPTMKGNIDTYGSINGKDSTGSNQINSFHSINRKAEQGGQIGKLKNDNGAKRSSIYKYALTKGGQGVDLTKELEKMVANQAQSDSYMSKSEDGSSDDSGTNKSKPAGLKSKFAK